MLYVVDGGWCLQECYLIKQAGGTFPEVGAPVLSLWNKLRSVYSV